MSKLLKKVWKVIVDIYNSVAFKRFMWTTLNGLTAVLIVYFTDSQDKAWAGIAVILLTAISQAITKYLNKK